ncbi:MAG: PASTA domain-containing protein [Chlorobiaceae bacterium]|nr:PASTA domain-containing protein [Chlorobiaceae bacterium]
MVFDRIVMPLYISQGSTRVVPDVTGKRFDDASRELKHEGFNAIKSYNIKYLSGVDSTLVLSQSPSPGTEVKPGRNIYLMVNRREVPSFPMPDLLGKLEFDARNAVTRLDMNVLSVDSAPVTDPEQDGKILAQSIPAQATVHTGDAVSITVGRYEAPAFEERRIAVPDVLGMSLSQAGQAITDSGLVPGKVTYEPSGMLVPNTVISQKPSAGTGMVSGQQVELTVSKP